MEIEIKDGKVSLQVAGTYTAEEFTKLLQRLGEARTQIAKDPASPIGVPVKLIANASFYTEPMGGLMQGMSGIYMLHPGYGWLGFGLPAIEAFRLANYLHSQVLLAFTATATATTPNAGTHDGNPGTDESGGGAFH